MFSAIRNVRTSVFWKLLAGFAAIALPVYALGFGMVSYGARTLMSEIEASNYEKQDLFLKHFDDQLNNINQMVVSLSNDTDFGDFYSRQNEKINTEKINLIHSITSKLKVVFYSSELINDVFVWLPGSQVKLSVLHGYSELNPSYEAVGAKAGDLSFEPKNDNGSLTYRIAISDPSLQSDKINYYIGAELSEERIVKSLQTFLTDRKFDVLLIDNQTKRTLGGKQLSPTDLELSGKLKGVLHQSFLEVEATGKSYLVQSGSTKNGNFTLVTYVLKDQVLAPIYLFKQLLRWFLLATIAVILLLSVMIFRQIHIPLQVLVKSMREVERGKYTVTYSKKAGGEFRFVFRQYENMINRLRTLIQDVLQKKIEVQKAELKQLQSQINPHFLFNCFYIGYRMAKSGETENVANLCKYLGDYFRFMTLRKDENMPIREELNFIRTYLEIQSLRFPDRLTYSIAADEDALSVSMPSLILQPLIENSIVHGVEKTSKTVHIEIRIKKQGGRVSVQVADDGAGLSSENLYELKNRLTAPTLDSEHCGLWNVNWRLRHLFGSGIRLFSGVDDAQTPNGFQAGFDIPLPQD